MADGSVLLAQKADDLPLGRDALFGDDAEAEGSKAVTDAPVAKPRAGGSGLRGFVQFELARTIDAPVHWSKMRTRAELSKQGNLGDGIKYRLGARMDADAVYSADDFYPGEVRRDQRARISLRENYIDFGAGGWDFRLGRQHAVWGEMVGLYFADVVSARDLTEFILPDFEAQRIPQWAARAEYFVGDLHAELLWVPVPSYDRIGKPGAEFYPLQPTPPGAVSVYRNEVKPSSRKLSNTNYGLRLSGLTNGWDLSAFYYRSMDVAPTFYREIQAPATFVFEARHDRISQLGGTLTKDLGTFVLKSEFVHTRGRQFTVLGLADADGLAASSTVDLAAGLDFPLPADSRLNVQWFQRSYATHDPDMIVDKRESGYSLFFTSKLADRVEAQLLWIASLERQDWLFRPKLTWNFEKNWRAQFGADIFKGPQLGLFGQYNGRDRVYSEVRYSF